MNPSTRVVQTVLVVVALLGSTLMTGPAAVAGPGARQAFLAHLSNTERAVVSAQKSLQRLNSGVIGHVRAIEAHADSLAASAASLSDTDVAALAESGSTAQRVATVSAEIAALQADPRLGQVLRPDRLAVVAASLAAARMALRVVTVKLHPTLVLWNTLGSAAELVSSPVGGPGTLTIPGAEFVAGRFGGGVLLPAERAAQSEQLRFGDYSLTREGTIELWFKQNGYDTFLGQPDDGRFHSFWSPDVAPYGVLGASLLTYQVPGEGWHFDIWDGTNYVRNSVTPDIAAGEWHHVAFAWSSEGSYTEVYLDGTLLNRVDQTLDIAAPVPLPLQLGFDWDANDRGATSTLDNLKIWSEARTDFADRLTE